MTRHALLLTGMMAVTLPAVAGGQGERYPITLIPPAKGPFTLPQGYQTLWDKIEILVTTSVASV